MANLTASARLLGGQASSRRGASTAIALMVRVVAPAGLVMATLRSQASVSKHSLMIAGHQTSISLEEAFWTALKHVAAKRSLSVAALVAEIDAARGTANLSSAIRVYLLETAISPTKDG